MSASAQPMRLVLALLAALCVLAGTAVTPALAQESVGGGAQPVAGFIVHKFTGSPENAGGETPVAGAVFEVRKLEGIDPLISDLAALVATNPALLTSDPGVPVGASISNITNEQGAAEFLGLEAGVYQVWEVPRRNSDELEEITNPFLIAIDPASREIRQIRAKILPIAITKTADREFAEPGEQITFRITANVVELSAQGRLYRLKLSDNFDANLRDPKVAGVWVRNERESLQLIQGEDYAVLLEGRTLTIELTAAGLEKVARLRAGHPKTLVQADVTATIAPDAAPGTVVYNRVEYITDGSCPRPGESPLECRNLLHNNRANAAVVGVEVPPQDGGAGWLLPGGILAWLGLSQGSTGGESSNDRQQGGQPGSQPRLPGRVNQALASTGASVLVVVAIAGLSLVIGLLLLWRRRRNEGDKERGAPQSSTRLDDGES